MIHRIVFSVNFKVNKKFNQYSFPKGDDHALQLAVIITLKFLGKMRCLRQLVHAQKLTVSGVKS